MIRRDELAGLEDEAFTKAAVAGTAAAAAGADPRLDRATDAAIRATLAAAYRAAADMVGHLGATAAIDELRRRAGAVEAGIDPDQ